MRQPLPVNGQDGKKLNDFADLILDTGAPVGDAMIYVPGLDTPVAPGSTLEVYCSSILLKLKLPGF